MFLLCMVDGKVYVWGGDTGGAEDAAYCNSNPLRWRVRGTQGPL